MKSRRNSPSIYPACLSQGGGYNERRDVTCLAEAIRVRRGEIDEWQSSAEGLRQRGESPPAVRRLGRGGFRSVNRPGVCRQGCGWVVGACGTRSQLRAASRVSFCGTCKWYESRRVDARKRECVLFDTASASPKRENGGRVRVYRRGRERAELWCPGGAVRRTK